MTKKNGRVAVGAAVAAFALVGITACGGAPSVPNLPSNLPSIPGVGDPRAAFGDAHQKALGLAALGGLGAAQGVGQNVKDLAPQVQSEGQGIDQKLRGLASAVGVTLPDALSPEQQQQVDDLKARTGEQFDQGWLKAAKDEQQKLKDQATALLNVPGLPEDQKNAARQQLDQLDQLGKKLADAESSAGAATPGQDGNQAAGQGGDDKGQSGNGSGNGGGNGSGDGSDGKNGPAVNAGTGGQAAESGTPALPFTLGGLGLALIAAAGMWLRRSRA